MAKVTLPKTIKIGPIVYRVVLQSGLHQDGKLLDGQHRPSDTMLALRAELEDNPYRRVVILHEIAHALFEISAVRLPDELLEPTCDALAYGFLGVVKDNPKLVQYLLE